jgi:hypothetical protein
MRDFQATFTGTESRSNFAGPEVHVCFAAGSAGAEPRPGEWDGRLARLFFTPMTGETPVPLWLLWKMGRRLRCVRCAYSALPAVGDRTLQSGKRLSNHILLEAPLHARELRGAIFWLQARDRHLLILNGVGKVSGRRVRGRKSVDRKRIVPVA